MKDLADFGKSILYYLFYAPCSFMFFVFCKLHGEEGNEFWRNMKPNTFNIIASIGWWLLIATIITGLILAGLSRSIPING